MTQSIKKSDFDKACFAQFKRPRVIEAHTAVLCAAVFLTSFSDKIFAGTENVTTLSACADISADLKRLACYDRLVGRDTQHTGKTAPVPVRVQAMETEEKYLQRMGTAEDVQIGEKYLRKEHVSSGSMSKNYELIAAYKDNKKRWVFEFEDGQVWRQIEAEYLPKPKSFPVMVTVSEGIFGSYNLRSEYISKKVKIKRLQ